MSLAILAATLLSGAAAPAAAVLPAEDPQLAAEILISGQSAEAILRLERALAFDPANPAMLINLGVAYAQRGDVVRAREAFKDAAGASEAVQVVTANGTQTDSRSLARRGLRILESDRYALGGTARGALTLRD